MDEKAIKIEEVVNPDVPAIPVVESYKFKIFGNYSTLNLSGELKDNQTEAYFKSILPEIEKSGMDLVINCNGVTKMSQAWLQALVVTEQSVRKAKKSVRLILVRDAVKSLIAEKALNRVLPINTNLRDALLSLNLVSAKSLDVGFVNPFLEATLHVMKVQSLIEAKAGKIFIKKEVSELSGDISGVIGLVSDSFSGNVIITFPEKTFLTLMSKMHGEEYTTINGENADGASEFTNMIFGYAKIILNEQGYGIKTALPSLIVGKSHRFATHFMEVTKDPIALKGILGHSNLKMTDKYAKVTDKIVYDGMMKFNDAILRPLT